MSKPIRFAVVVGLLAMVVAVEVVRWHLDSQVRSFEVDSTAFALTRVQANMRPTAPFTACMIPPEGEEVIRKTYLKLRVNEHNADVWAALQHRVVMPFAEETPLGEFLQYIKTATKTPERPEGLSIYVDPIGLEETEKTIDSPITLDVKDVPLSQSLELGLSELGLGYRVEENGLIVVSALLSRERNPVDADLEMLEQIQHLRDEVAALRLELAATRGGMLVPISKGGIAGGGYGYLGAASSGFR